MQMAERFSRVAIGQLVPYARNARVHPEEQIHQLRASLREFGFVAPVVIDAGYNILAGHARVLAAKAEGMTEVPCVFAEHLTDAQRRAYILADNRLAESAQWDMELVRLELEELTASDFDVGLTGFTMEDMPLFEAEADPADDDFAGEMDDVPTRCAVGEIYQLGGASAAVRGLHERSDGA